MPKRPQATIPAPTKTPTSDRADCAGRRSVRVISARYVAELFRDVDEASTTSGVELRTSPFHQWRCRPFVRAGALVDAPTDDGVVRTSGQRDIRRPGTGIASPAGWPGSPMPSSAHGGSRPCPGHVQEPHTHAQAAFGTLNRLAAQQRVFFDDFELMVGQLARLEQDVVRDADLPISAAALDLYNRSIIWGLSTASKRGCARRRSARAFT